VLKQGADLRSDGRELLGIRAGHGTGSDPANSRYASSRVRASILNAFQRTAGSDRSYAL
jgi:hypothetical protein